MLLVHGDRGDRVHDLGRHRVGASVSDDWRAFWLVVAFALTFIAISLLTGCRRPIRVIDPALHDKRRGLHAVHQVRDVNAEM